MSLPPPMSLDDDDGAVFLARLHADTKTPPSVASFTTTETSSMSLLALPNSDTQHRSLASPPPLPQRNSMRRSRLLDPIALTAAAPAAPATTAVATAAVTAAPQTPHDAYLSSEEDVSSVGDVSENDAEDREDGGLALAGYAQDFIDDDDEEEDDEDGGIDLTSDFEDDLADTADASPYSVDTVVRSATAPPIGPSRPPPAPVSLATLHELGRRYSHDTARLVSVVFSGKPCLVDVAVERAARRGGCLGSPMRSKKLVSSASSVKSVASSYCTATSSTGDADENTRPSTSCETLSPRSSNASVLARFQNQNRKSIADATAIAEIRESAAKKSLAPAFLQIDPFANGSTYSFDKTVCPTETPRCEPPRYEPARYEPAQYEPSRYEPPKYAPLSTAPPKRSFTAPVSQFNTCSSPAPSTPRTPTAILRGVTRTLTLSRRRSRPVLRDEVLAQSPVALSTGSSPLPKIRPLSSVSYIPPAPSPSPSPANMLRSSRRKSFALSMISSSGAGFMPALPVPEAEQAPEQRSGSPFLKKGGASAFLGNLAQRRKSLRIVSSNR